MFYSLLGNIERCLIRGNSWKDNKNIMIAHIVQGISFTIFKNMCETSDVHVLEVEAMSVAILAKQLSGVKLMKEDPKK